MSPKPLPRRAVRATTAAAMAAAVCLSACGGDPPALSGSLKSEQIVGLDRAWSQRITAVSAPATTATQEATALYKACATMDQASTFLQAVHATCAPTAVSVKLGAVIPQRCAAPNRRCIRALDRAKAANDTLLAALIQLTDSVKTATTAPECRAEFATEGAKAQAYRDLSTAYDAIALGAERGDRDIMRLGQRKITQANATIASRLPASEQITRFRQACGVTSS
jgi:hypothetical protein